MNRDVDPKAYWIAFNKVPGIGPARIKNLLDSFGSLELAWKASIQQLQSTELDRRSLENLLEARRTLDVRSEWQCVQKTNVRCCSVG